MRRVSERVSEVEWSGEWSGVEWSGGGGEEEGTRRQRGCKAHGKSRAGGQQMSAKPPTRFRARKAQGNVRMAKASE